MKAQLPVSDDIVHPSNEQNTLRSTRKARRGNKSRGPRYFVCMMLFILLSGHAILQWEHDYVRR